MNYVNWIKLVDWDSVLITILEEACVLVETLQAEIFASGFSIESNIVWKIACDLVEIYEWRSCLDNWQLNNLIEYSLKDSLGPRWIIYELRSLLVDLALNSI